jgi:alginate O-acetyltransferase complex protein AlgI
MLAFRPNIRNLLAAAVLLFWCVMSFSGVSTFLYFNF